MFSQYDLINLSLPWRFAFVAESLEADQTNTTLSLKAKLEKKNKQESDMMEVACSRSRLKKIMCPFFCGVLEKLPDEGRLESLWIMMFANDIVISNESSIKAPAICVVL